MRFLFLLVLLLLSLNGWSRDIFVAAAANVRYALDELKDVFEEKSGLNIKISVASSGKLTAQIKNGAPFDIFLSANMKYPNYLYKEGFAIDRPKIYAFGSLVIWTLRDDIEIKNGIDALKNKNIKKAAIANPKNAPYGTEALRAIKKAGIYEDVKNKLIYGESIAQTSQYIVSKAADAGITAKSVVLSPKMRKKGKWVEINPSLYNPVKQGAVMLKNAKTHLKDVEKFYNFLFGEEAKKIFTKYGYKIR